MTTENAQISKIRGCVPPIIAIAVREGTKTSTNSTVTAIQISIISFLKNFLIMKKGWGFNLLVALLQDVKDE